VDGKVVEIAVDRVRTISKVRLGERIDKVDGSIAASIRHLITGMYGVLTISA
jgi:hypothetical protein